MNLNLNKAFTCAYRRARRQDIKHGDPSSHCWDTEDGKKTYEGVCVCVCAHMEHKSTKSTVLF